MRTTFVLLLSFFTGVAQAQDLASYATWYPPFSRCDLHLAARGWKVTDDEASIKLQQLVSAGKADEVKAVIAAVKPTITATGWEVCDYSEPGFSYFDAEQLASYWGLGDASEAKARIEEKLISNNEAILSRDIDAARATGPAADGYNEEADAKRQIFFDAGYDWCDAEALAAAWGTDFDDAKMRAADKLTAGAGKKLKKMIKKAKKKFQPDGCGGE